jgi:TRAP transporter 4TM/12TM fusion protein
VWLTVTTFAYHFQPEFVALSALTAAVGTNLLEFRRGETIRPAGPSAICAAVACVAAAIWLSRELVSERERIPLLQPLSTDMLIAGSSVVLASMILVIRSLGIAVALIVCSLVVYVLFGHLLGGAVGHGYIRPSHFLDLMFFTTDGMLGTPLAVATGTVVHFLLFAAILERTGATGIFCEIAERACGSGRGGTAKVAVVSSALFGTISGSPTSDVVATGSMTIPAMCAAGYSRNKAAAIEVAASTGGSILPPIMGTAAFLLAEYTGTSYSEVLIAAALPGVMYFGALFMSVALDARRHDYRNCQIAPPAERGPVRYLQLALPGGALIVVIMLDYPPAYAAAAGTIVALITSVFRTRGPLRPVDIAQALESTGRRMIPVLSACAAAGLIIGSITMSGLSGKTASLLLSLTGGVLLPTLVVVAMVGILFGLGMPTTSAYILGAILLAPALTDTGVPVLAAHLFVLYFAVLSAMTPPVAVAAFAAASISGGSPYAIGLRSIRFAAAAFILPFAFVFFPGLLLEGDTFSIVAAVLRSTASIAVIIIAFEGMARDTLRGHERIATTAGGLLILTPNMAAASFGIILVVVSLARQLPTRLRGR